MVHLLRDVNFTSIKLLKKKAWGLVSHSQHSGGGSKRVKSSRTALVTNWVWSQPGLCETLPQKQTSQTSKNTKDSYKRKLLPGVSHAGPQWLIEMECHRFRGRLRAAVEKRWAGAMPESPNTDVRTSLDVRVSADALLALLFWNVCTELCELILKGRMMRTKARLGGPGRNKKR